MDNFIWKYKWDDILLSLTLKIKKMKQRKEKIVETLKNLQTLIKELEDFIEPTNDTSKNWIQELINNAENIKFNLFRIK